MVQAIAGTVFVFGLVFARCGYVEVRHGDRMLGRFFYWALAVAFGLSGVFFGSTLL